ncbi:PREDICTED: rab9 effector protein with kelch motifs-like isoform X3 [Nelumbo nucifera]|uniref:Rab9 effector protein with kelch motifs-like isoform X3 n=1 Tax=Nelumbo nucifera TaxID=4432 RepID=A0A1U8ADU4_NELNU|nr:PREDICTED: rab9 effector protein with kelch motifs-like isoform X3 [Nelumbo nucifera]
MRWEKIELSSRLREALDGKKSPGRKGGIFGPGKRWGHSCNAVKGGKFLYVFGGYGKDNCQTNDVHVFDTVRQTWSKPMVKGIPPSPRDSHSCTTVGNSLFVFGGTDGKTPLKDLHILDTSSNTWMTPSVVGEGPEAREGHSAALIGKRLFIFGGCGKSWNGSTEVYYNDLYILDTETFMWKHALTSGTPPSARDSHTCSSWMNKIIVVGGEDASDYYLSDVHILDTDTLVWRELYTSGQVLPPRAGHSTVAFGKNLFVFGGFTNARNLYDDLHMLNVESGIWTKVIATGQGPSARFSVAGDCLDPQKGLIVFIGGCNNELEALDDMYYLHTVDLSVENGQDEEGQEKFSLRKELQKKCQEQYVPASLPIISKDVPKLGVMPDMSQPMPLPCFKEDKQTLPLNDFTRLEEKMFEAKVTDVLNCGYAIETNIDGKTLRGILFSFKPTLSHAANDYLSRKRTGLEVGGIKLNDGDEPGTKMAKPIDQQQVYKNLEPSAEPPPYPKDDGANNQGAVDMVSLPPN